MLNIFSRCTYFLKSLCLIYIWFVADVVKGDQSFLVFVVFSAVFIISHTSWFSGLCVGRVTRCRRYLSLRKVTQSQYKPQDLLSSAQGINHNTAQRQSVLWSALGICPCWCVRSEAKKWNSYDVAVVTE